MTNAQLRRYRPQLVAAAEAPPPSRHRGLLLSSIGTVNSMITAGLLVVLAQASPVALGQTAEERGLAIAVEADRRDRGFGDSTAALRMVLRSRGGDERSPLDVVPSEIVLVMGPSGSGKTSLLSMLGGLLRPSAGTVEIDGIEITAKTEAELPSVRSRKVGFVFQAFNLLEALSVKENVLFPAQLITGGMRAARDRATRLLDQLGLTHRRHALPKTLSGGEKQRVAIARALIHQPSLILADEPTGNLDSHSGQEVMMILHDIARDEQRSVVFVTHDPRVEEIADRILWLEDGALRDRKAADHSWVIDPVCGMRLDQWTAVLSSEHEGRRYSFCSTRCQERFAANPSAYTEQGSQPSEVAGGN